METTSPGVKPIYKDKARKQGSGVVIAPNTVLTNCHVLTGTGKKEAEYRGKTFELDIQYADLERDLCQFKSPTLDLKPVKIGPSSSVKVGQPVYAIGAPHGLELTISQGIISSLREIEGQRYIQVTAAVSPGSSGGGLFNDQGELIGITTFYVENGQTLNFAVPIDYLSELPKRHEKFLKASNESMEFLFESMAALANEDWEKLLELSRKSIDIFGYNPAVWADLGLALRQLNRYDESIKAYRQALKLDASAETYTGLGWVYSDRSFNSSGEQIKFDEDELKEAKDAFETALTIDEEYGDAWAGLGYIHMLLKNYSKAIKALTSATKYQPDQSRNWRFLGMAYGDNGDRAMALIAYKKAVELAPNSLVDWISLGLAAAEAGRTDLVIETYKNLKRINPKAAEKFFADYMR